MAPDRTAGQMWRWNFDPCLSIPAPQVPTLPLGASREGKEIEDAGGAAPECEGKEQGVQCSVRLQPGVWTRA